MITSSNGRSLKPFVDELVAISSLKHIDLYVLRDRDVLDIIQAGTNNLVGPQGQVLTLDNMYQFSSAQLMAIPRNAEVAKHWFLNQLQHRPELHVPAFATYFPQIANMHNLDYRQAAIDALANTICMGLEIQRQLAERRDMCPNGTGTIDDVIIEAVCGSRFDEYMPNQTGQVIEQKLDDKIDFILKGLEKVRQLVQAWCKTQYKDAQPPCRWTIGVELEPGNTYVLRDLESLHRFFTILHERFPALAPYVGLNVDIAHMIMAGVRSAELTQSQEIPKLKDVLVHAHIADHPGMHTRDQRMGEFMPVDRFEAEEYAFLVDLAETWGKRRSAQAGLPCSGCIAVELEGCGRMGWVHRSVQVLRQMCEAVWNFSGVIRRRS